MSSTEFVTTNLKGSCLPGVACYLGRATFSRISGGHTPRHRQSNDIFLKTSALGLLVPTTLSKQASF